MIHKFFKWIPLGSKKNEPTMDNSLATQEQETIKHP